MINDEVLHAQTRILRSGAQNQADWGRHVADCPQRLKERSRPLNPGVLLRLWYRLSPVKFCPRCGR